MRPALSLLALIAAGAAAAQDAPTPQGPKLDAEKLRQLYDDALSAEQGGNHKKAAQLLHAWLAEAPRTAPTYDAAQHVLAGALHSLGLIHAAFLYESGVIKTRARPELLPEALARVEQWGSEAPHDEERFDAEVLTQDFGSVEGNVKAFVAYRQGAIDLRNNNLRWADARFAELPDKSPYRARAKLLDAALKLSRGEDPRALINDFEELANDQTAPREARNEARISAARLRFDVGDYAESIKLYDAVQLPELDPGRGQLYLEQAWAHYRKGEGGRAVGLLAALDSPAFRHLFLPDKYLLRALVFKDACHWLAAKRAARVLLRRYGDALAAIRERKPLADEPQLTEAALQKGSAKRAAELVSEPDLERDRLTRMTSALGDSLAARLNEIYAAEQAEAKRRLQLETERGVINVADELLHAAEQVSLVDYEVGLALYRRARQQKTEAPLAFDDVALRDRELAYGFDGEYWNDELLHYRFALPDRCAQGVTGDEVTR